MRSVDPAKKAAAIADLLAGEQPAVVAERYGLNRQTVKAWKVRAADELQPAMQPMQPTTTGPTRYPSIEARQARVVELIYENLIAKLTATQRLAEHVTREEWLNRQSADGVAALGGWLDSTARATLELLARPASDERPAE